MAYIYFMSSFYKITRHILLCVLILILIIPIALMSIKKYNDQQYFDDFVKSIGHFPMNLTFNNLNYRTTDDKNNLISVSSPEGVADDLETQKILLKKPTINVTSNENPITINAEHGSFDRLEKNIVFRDNVTITDIDAKNTAKTEIVTFDIETGIVKVPQTIDANLEKGQVNAGSISASQDDKKIYFSDGIKMIIKP